MLIAGDSTNVTTYFAVRLAADGTAATGLTATNFDLQYVRSGAAPSVKADATAGTAGGAAAHVDNTVVEPDATDQPGLYRVDWPNAAFAAGVREVILTVKVATAFTEHLRCEIDGEVNVVEWAGTDVVAGAIPAVAADGIGGLPISDAGGLDLDALAGDFNATQKTSLNNATPAVTVSDKTGFSLSTAGILAIWDQLTSATVAVGSMGKKLADWIVGTIDTYTGNTKQTADHTAGIAAIPTTMVGTNNAALAATALSTATWTATRAGYIDELAAANLPTDIAAIPTTAMRGTDNANTTKAGFSLSAAGVDAIYDEEVDNDGTAISQRGAWKLALAILAGKSSGGGTATLVFRDINDAKDRVSATVDANGNRTAVGTRDAT